MVKYLKNTELRMKELLAEQNPHWSPPPSPMFIVKHLTRIFHKGEALDPINDLMEHYSSCNENGTGVFRDSKAVNLKINEFTDKVSNLARQVDITEIKARLESSVSNIINVMTVFIFKTLILPLLFLYLLLKGTNWIWCINVQAMLSKETNSAH
jgi:hypothetical protein